MESESPQYRVIVWDLETTGLNPYVDDIIEVAMSDNFGRRFQSLIHTTKELSYTIRKLTGLDNRDLQGQPTIQQVLTDVKVFLEEEPALPIILVGHNSHKFDRLFLLQACQRHDITLPSTIVWMDTLLMAQYFFPDLTSYSLKSLCEGFAIQQTNAHRAMGDVIATEQLLDRMIRRVCKQHQSDVNRAIDFIRSRIYMG